MKYATLLLLASLAGAVHAVEPATLKPTQTIPLPGVQGRFDHFAIDVKGRRLLVAALGNNTRLYLSCGEGFIDVIDQRGADSYQLCERIPTRAGARTAFFSKDLNQFYLAVPQRGNQPAELRVFQTQN